MTSDEDLHDAIDVLGHAGELLERTSAHVALATSFVTAGLEPRGDVEVPGRVRGRG